LGEADRLDGYAGEDFDRRGDIQVGRLIVMPNLPANIPVALNATYAEPSNRLGNLLCMFSPSHPTGPEFSISVGSILSIFHNRGPVLEFPPGARFVLTSEILFFREIVGI
jgi:hypothetical protein